MAQIATIPKEVEDTLKRFRGTSPPLICYIDQKSGTPTVRIDSGVLDEDEEFSIETLASSLPYNAPRYILLNHKPEGEAFSKVIFINWIPNGCQTVASMLHVGTLPVIERLARNPKVLEVNDAEDGLTTEIIDAKLRR